MQRVIPKIFILIIFFFSLISTHAQEEKVFEFMVKGRAYDNQNNKLAGVKVIIKQNGKVIKTFTSSTSGILPGEPVPFGHMYTFIYEKPGYTKVTMAIDSKNGYFPDDFMYSKPMDKNNPTVMAIPEPRITLYKKVPNIDYSVLENKPRAKLGFQRGEFDFDKHYINSRKNEVDGFLNKIEEQLEKIEQDYQNLVSAGDKAYAAGDYAAAMVQYKKALAVKPDNKALNDKIAKTTEKIRLAEELKKKQAEFDKIIADGDNLLSQDKLDEAVAKYKAAQSIMPTSGVPNKKLALVNKRREELAAIARKKQFDAIVANADNLFQQKNIEEAKLKYQEASALISDEPYPKQQLVEIERLIKERKQKELNYAKLLSEGDQFLSSKEFEKSLSKYQEALALLPEKSPEVNDRIKKLEEAKRKAEELRKREQQYKDLMASAEKSLAAKQYVGAIGLFKQASGLFSDRPLPKERINYASQLKEKAEAEKRKKEQFNQLIDKADGEFSSKSYGEAKSTYDEALKLYPDDAYAKKRYAEAIQKIREIEEEKKRLAEIEKQYKGFIAQGNEFKNTEKYPEAIKAYNAALGIKSGDPVAIQKIEEVKKIIKQKEEEKLKREKYESLLTEAGRLFTTKDYETAIDKYTEASNLFQNEAYPKEQIILAQAKLKEKQEEERRLAEEQKRKDDFDKLIAQADDRFNSENYEEAISVYQQAKTLFPSNPYPTQKINAAEKLLRKKAEEEAKQKSQAERDAEFKRLIEEGDQLFTQEQYDKAKLAYNNALALKDTPELRKKIADSDRMIAEQNAKKQQELDNKSIDDQYNKIVSSADAAIETGDYKSAKKLYQKALTFKNEEYPKSKIAQIDEQFKKDLESQNQAFAEAKKKEEFNTLISKGDNAINSENFSAGIAYYEQAKKLEIDNTVVDAKIAKATQLETEYHSKISQNNSSSSKEDDYNNAIQLADKAFNQEDYKRAISKYQEALNYKPNENYPIDRIRLAEQKLDEISSLNNSNLIEEEYTRFVTKASDEENLGKLNEAKQFYERALNVKKGDQYAHQQIARLSQKLLDIENEKYQGLIESGDDKFEEEKYVPAKEDYTEALDIKPGDIYPKDKITEIDEILEEQKTESTYVASDQSYYDLDGYQEVVMTEDEIIAMMEQSVDDNDYTRPQISQQTEDQNSNSGFERILSNRDKSLQLEEEYNDIKSGSEKKEISLDKQRVAATNELETVIDKTVKTGDSWQGNQQRITQNQDEYVQQLESNRQTDELEGGLRRDRVLDEYGNYIDATAREAAEIQSVTDIRRGEIEAEMNINEQDREQADLENDFRRETFVSETEATGDENSAKQYSLTDEATKKSNAAEESYDLLETERTTRLLEADKPREFKTQQLEIYTQNQRLDENNRIEKSKSALLANQDAADDITTRIAQEAIDNDAPRKEVMKEYESYEDQRVYIFNEYEKTSNEKSLSNEMAYNEIESQRAEEFLSADQPRLNANVELALYQEDALQAEVDRKGQTDLRNGETYKDYGNLTLDSEEKAIKSDVRRNRAIINTENSNQSNIESNKSDASFADSKRQSIADQVDGNVSEEQEKSLIGKANQEKNSTSINQYSDQNTNQNNSIRNNAQNKNLETAEEMDEDDRQSPTHMSDQMTDDLALKYPEGVTEKKYASKNNQGQVTGYVMIRIVVKGNKGWEYKKEVTNQITRFYKNGVPITSDVWDNETSGPAAE